MPAKIQADGGVEAICHGRILQQAEAADRIESAVKSVLAQGLRTADIHSEGTTKVGTRQMGDAVVAAITKKTITKS